MSNRKRSRDCAPAEDVAGQQFVDNSSADIRGDLLPASGLKAFSREWGDTIRMVAGVLGVAMIFHTWILPMLVTDSRPVIDNISYGAARYMGSDLIEVDVRFIKNKDYTLQAPAQYTATWTGQNTGAFFAANLYPVVQFKPSENEQVWIAQFRLPRFYDTREGAISSLTFNYAKPNGGIEIFHWPPMKIRGISDKERDKVIQIIREQRR